MKETIGRLKSVSGGLAMATTNAAGDPNRKAHMILLKAEVDAAIKTMEETEEFYTDEDMADLAASIQELHNRIYGRSSENVTVEPAFTVKSTSARPGKKSRSN